MRALILIPLTLAVFGAFISPSTTAAQQPKVNTEVYLHGIVKPMRQVFVSSQIAARLEGFAAQPGSRVSAGELLVQLDDRVARASVFAARAAAESNAKLDYAKAEVELARTTLERHRRAEERGASNQRALEEAEARVLQASASLRSAQETLDQAAANLALEEAKLAQYSLRAPFAGTVTRHFVDPGQTITAAQELVHLVDLSTLEVELFLPLSLWGKLTIGETYPMVASDPVGGVLNARLRYIDPMLQPATRHMRCLFEIDNSAGELPAGFTVEFPRRGA